MARNLMIRLTKSLPHCYNLPPDGGATVGPGVVVGGAVAVGRKIQKLYLML